MVPLGTSLQEYGNDATNAESTDDVVGALEQSRDAIGDAADEISSLDPPEGVDDEQDALVDLLNGYRDDVEAAIGAVEDEDLSGIADFQTASVEFGTELDQLRSDFSDAGIDVGD